MKTHSFVTCERERKLIFYLGKYHADPFCHDPNSEAKALNRKFFEFKNEKLMFKLNQEFFLIQSQNLETHMCLIHVLYFQASLAQ
jgi:hypothetical protein